MLCARITLMRCQNSANAGEVYISSQEISSCMTVLDCSVDVGSRQKSLFFIMRG